MNRGFYKFYSIIVVALCTLFNVSSCSDSGGSSRGWSSGYSSGGGWSSGGSYHK
ncbi:hypothetical protein ACTSKR_15870 [Chitinibacteraceae bacterium HSL-7]